MSLPRRRGRGRGCRAVLSEAPKGEQAGAADHARGEQFVLCPPIPNTARRIPRKMIDAGAQ